VPRRGSTTTTAAEKTGSATARQIATVGRVLPSSLVLFATLVAAVAVAAPASVEPPVALTSSDGECLELVAYDSDTVVAGPLAFTELRLSFKTPSTASSSTTARVVLLSRVAPS
jgi:hypothetical protein